MTGIKIIYGLIGDPVEHSLSPQLHNAAFKALGIHTEYRLFHVREKELESFFDRMRQGEILGVNVTIPHKEKVFSFLDHLTPLARHVGAVNLILRQKDGSLSGDNTDGPGYLSSLIAQTHFDSHHENVVVIGVGGAGRAICHLLCDNKIKSLTLINRTASRAQNLVENLKHYHPEIKYAVHALSQIPQASLKKCHLLINASAMGLPDHHWMSLDFIEDLNPQAIVSDIVYTPPDTPLLQAARRHGNTVHDGLSMLLYQGILTFERFTGKRAPVDVMRESLY